VHELEVAAPLVVLHSVMDDGGPHRFVDAA
jgi:hypothetical protein